MERHTHRVSEIRTESDRHAQSLRDIYTELEKHTQSQRDTHSQIIHVHNYRDTHNVRQRARN